jgi:DNA-binding CsgD family transcriptional regulator
VLRGVELLRRFHVPNPSARLRLAEIAASAEPLDQRAEAMLGTLRHLVPFDGAWMALADPSTNSYRSLGGADLDESTMRYLSGPATARDIEASGSNRARSPLSVSDLPYPAEAFQVWAECLIPAGYHEGLGVGLFAPGGRHVGYLALLSGDHEAPSEATRRRLGRLCSTLALGIDPMRSLQTTSRIVRGATAGVVLHADGGTQPLTGLDDHDLLSRLSPLVATARVALSAGDVSRSFLWPLGGRHAPHGHTRVTALASSDDVRPGLVGMVILSPPPDQRGLTPRELEVLGWVIDGRSNREISRALSVAQRTVAAHVEHILAKFEAPTRTLAAVRAEREGLYVPRSDAEPG